MTPDMHRVHHSIVRAETDSNFGFNLPWWDRLFGTYRREPQAGHDGMTIGIPMFRDRKELRLDRMLMQPFWKDGGEAGLDEYSSRGLTRTWRAQRFSWWMTSMLHKQEPENPFDYRRQLAELEYLVSSTAAMNGLAENYVGAPFD